MDYGHQVNFRGPESVACELSASGRGIVLVECQEAVARHGVGIHESYSMGKV